MYEFYKIKDPDFEYYSSGLRNGWVQKSKKGKTWNALGHVKSHLKQVQNHDSKAFELFYDKWLVIRITENGVEILGTVKDFK